MASYFWDRYGGLVCCFRGSKTRPELIAENERRILFVAMHALPPSASRMVFDLRNDDHGSKPMWNGPNVIWSLQMQHRFKNAQAALSVSLGL
jgi:hypothetical protein